MDLESHKPGRDPPLELISYVALSNFLNIFELHFPYL